jgi:arylsulfatase A-like enzyme
MPYHHALRLQVFRVGAEMHAVVLTFDRLPAHMIGCYGNEWIETPGFDALAVVSNVFERHLVELPGPAGASHPWWTGRFEFFSRATGTTVFETLAAGGVRCRMVTERAEGLPEQGLDSIERVAGSHGMDVPHADVPFARLIQRGQELIAEFDAEHSELLWLHSEGIPSPWLPPEFFAGLYLDELEDRLEGSGQELAGQVLDHLRDDPVLATLLLSEADDDELDEDAETEPLDATFGEAGLAIARFVFGGYVSLIDHWLQKLTAALAASPHDVLFIVTASGGHSFGEQRSFLRDAGRTPAESLSSSFGDQTLQTPLLLSRPGAQTEGARLLALVQPPEIPATLCDWFDATSSLEWCEGNSLLDRAGSAGIPGRESTVHLSDSGEIGLQDRHWFVTTRRDAIETIGSDIEAVNARLFRKPDDFWEVHNLAEQSPDECQRLLELLQSRVADRDS